MVCRRKGESQKLRLQENKACQNHLFCDSSFCLITVNICSNATDAVLKKMRIEWESHLIPILSVILFNILLICSSPFVSNIHSLFLLSWALNIAGILMTVLDFYTFIHYRVNMFSKAFKNILNKISMHNVQQPQNAVKMRKKYEVL